ncbi:hypothetical protein AMC99_02404 [Altererythrobacter epoxidivorans]|uniref:Peptidase M28 domain-containing protein n=1 Tax=Altererythrobacter epoxidivorans TaxID=361183 RepID=A0A0M4LWH5_9SPHN|nr:M28 family metallopeptidase [Altererythrobacter epoxidivorans]ALE17679.1 hypothetical protein AMC99_02404 [Altererythrobacter epoxidivorans]
MIRTALAAAASLMLISCTPTHREAMFDLPDVQRGDLSEDTMKDVTRTLSLDEFEGRMPGTLGEEKTVAYLTERFEAAGLTPGNNGSWVQEVPLVEVTGSDFKPLTVSGEGTDMSFEYGKDWVGVTYREDANTVLSDSEMVFVGYGVNAPERGWNDYADVDVKGKTVVILVNDPDYASDSLEGDFNGRAMTYYGRWTYKYEEAARQGAAAALIVHDTEPASYGWNVVESSWSGPQAYAKRGKDAPEQTNVNGWIQKEVAREILAASGNDLDELSALARTKGFRAVPLGLKASTGFSNSVRSYTSHNVIGMLPGSERPDEYVIHTAHWDHLGRCKPADDGDDICNGAVDNATGTAALVALAEAHAKKGPTARTLVFLAVTAEEQGLLGADYYAANPVFPLNQTVGGLNMDAFLVMGEAKDATVIGGGKSELDLFLDKALKDEGRTATDDPSPQAGYYYRSDHFAFAKRGVPMIYLKDGQDLVAGGKEAGMAVQAEYRANRYHSPKDEFDENWDWTGVMSNLQLFYRIGRMMGESGDWPMWKFGDEFRSIREESCASGDGGC